jgi:hypothetical protein
MEASEPAHRNGEPRIELLEIEVDGDTIDWRDFPQWPREHRTKGKEQLARTPQRKDALDLLVELLRHHSDELRIDQISDDLYGDLLKVVGQQLFDLLFVGQVSERVASALSRLEDKEIDLFRVKLSFEGQHGGWLSTLPWEYVHTPPEDNRFDPKGIFLSKRAELMLSRRLETGNLRTLGDRRPLTVLLISPNPRWDREGNSLEKQLVRLDPGKVIDQLKGLQDAHVIRLEQLIDEAPDYPVEDPQWVTRRRLIERLEELAEEQPPRSPVIVHFVGHGRSSGGRGELLFSSADGKEQWIKADDFTDIVGTSTSLKLVFLQACESALPDPYVPFSGVALGLASSGIPAVVAMQYRIKAELATAFTEAFYETLLERNSAIDVAVEAGRKRLWKQSEEGDRLAFGLPVVYLASHEGMLLDEPATTPGGGGEQPIDRRDLKPCPRCHAQLRPNATVCRRCGLMFTCGNCGSTHIDPVTDQHCDVCGTAIHQPPWPADALTRGEAVSQLAAGALSVAQGPRAVEEP